MIRINIDILIILLFYMTTFVVIKKKLIAGKIQINYLMIRIRILHQYLIILI